MYPGSRLTTAQDIIEKIVRSYGLRTTIITERNLYKNDMTILFSYFVDVNCWIYSKTRKP